MPGALAAAAGVGDGGDVSVESLSALLQSNPLLEGAMATSAARRGAGSTKAYDRRMDQFISILNTSFPNCSLEYLNELHQDAGDSEKQTLVGGILLVVFKAISEKSKSGKSATTNVTRTALNSLYDFGACFYGSTRKLGEHRAVVGFLKGLHEQEKKTIGGGSKAPALDHPQFMAMLSGCVKLASQALDEKDMGKSAAALVGLAMAVLTMYLCCRSISVKRITWNHLVLDYDPDTAAGYVPTLAMHKAKVGDIGAPQFRVKIYNNYESTLNCPVLMLCVVLFLFADEIEQAGSESGAWSGNGGLGGDVFDDGDDDADGDAAGDASDATTARAFVMPNVKPGANFDFYNANKTGFTNFWRDACAAGGIGPVNLTGHSYRNMAHTFAYLMGVSDDDLRKYAVWLNGQVQAG